ncbi:MAG: DNA polymerase III subunit delta [Firmicutes bacterium]|nr:DNA polymerase III subunit delta [Bacillota bacterium]
MNYLLYGKELFLIDKEVKNIINKNNIEEINISKYDLELNSLNEILDDANTVSLFSNNKLIIVENAYIFSRTQNKKIDNVEILEDYLKNKSDTIIIFINNNEKIDSVKKIVKLIKEKGIIKEFNPLKNINSTVKNMFENYKISDSTINLLVDRVGNNLELIYQEVEKLKIYKIDDKTITNKDIEDIVVENINIDIFKFVDDIINKNKKGAIKTYKELLKLNEEPIKIVALLASKFRLMYQASILAKKGYTEENISEILKVHKYPVHLAILSGYKYSSEILLKYLNDLADLDIGIKTGEKDKELALELFILSL